jgi:hypothetical protein
VVFKIPEPKLCAWEGSSRGFRALGKGEGGLILAEKFSTSSGIRVR